MSEDEMRGYERLLDAIDELPPGQSTEMDVIETCGCGHPVAVHGSLGCMAELGEGGSGSVADIVFCRCVISDYPPGVTK